MHFNCPKIPTKNETYPLDIETYPNLYSELSKSGEEVNFAELVSSTNGLFLFGFKYELRTHFHERGIMGGIIDSIIYLTCPKKVRICTYPVHVISD